MLSEVLFENVLATSTMHLPTTPVFTALNSNVQEPTLFAVITKVPSLFASSDATSESEHVYVIRESDTLRGEIAMLIDFFSFTSNSSLCGFIVMLSMQISDICTGLLSNIVFSPFITV